MDAWLLPDSAKEQGCIPSRRGLQSRLGKARLAKVQSPASLANGGYNTDFPKLFFIPSWPKLLGVSILGVLVSLCLTVWKDPLEGGGLPGDVLLKFISLPIVSVVFTYSHIWAALWMTFYPLEFFGIPGTQLHEQPWGVGWQGIVPSKVRKMSTILIRTMLTKLVTLDEVFARIDPEALLREIDASLAIAVEQVINEVGMDQAPETWRAIPNTVKDELVIRVGEEAPKLIKDVLDQIKADVSQVFDIEEMVVRALCDDKPLLNHMFLSVGLQELEFIRDAGAYMGLFFGIVQMVQQYYCPAGWLLPVFGVVVGLFTNWLALKMIFEPVYPHSFCGGRIVIQGQFLRRQYEVAPEYGKIFAEKVCAAHQLVRGILVGRRRDKFCALMHKEVSSAIDRCAGVIKPVVAMAGAQTSYAKAKQAATDKVVDVLPRVFMTAFGYLDKALGIEDLLTERVRAMDVGDFEQLLHPVFKEDEWILILLGGILGYVVGSLQWYVLGS